MISRLFQVHGQLCGSHPWEVIVLSLISIIYILSSIGTVYEVGQCSTSFNVGQSGSNPAKAEIILLALAKCMALFCVYNQFKHLWKQRSNYILVVASVFMLLSCIVFIFSVIYLFGGIFSDLGTALPFFLLMSDLYKVGSLTKYALGSSTPQEVRNNIAHGMSDLGPAITLDTVVGTLAIGIGSLAGVKSLEEMSSFACLAVIVNYFMFLTFLPSSLSLALELTHWKRKEFSVIEKLQQEKEQKLNPALQRVKVIMSAGLVLVHAHCRWMLPSDDDSVNAISTSGSDITSKAPHNLDVDNLDGYLYKWLNIGPDELVFLGLTFALVIRYVFYESHDDISSQIEMNPQENAVKESRFRGNSENHDSKAANEMLQKEIVNYTLQERYNSSRSISFVVGESIDYHAKEVSSVATQTKEGEVKVTDEITPTSRCNQVGNEGTLEECLELLKKGEVRSLNDNEIIKLVKAKHIPAYKLETELKNHGRGVQIRRKLLSENLSNALDDLPHENFCYDKVAGACCENVIGYMPVPVGVAGPMLLDDVMYQVPMATTEGCLVASVNRGFRALVSGGGIHSSIVADGMSRAPVVRFPSTQRAAEIMKWLMKNENYLILKEKFDSTSRFARLQKLHIRIAGRYLFVRFVATTGDAMGMNMLSKGTEAALKTLEFYFSDIEVLSISGNYCSDKKPAAVNWIEGRGKSVVCEAVVPEDIVKTILKTNVQSLIDVNISKNLIGSAVAGSLGGFNAQAANVVAALFIATGQDPAQVVTSSNCMTLMEPAGPNGQDLYITVTMPSIEIGTIGGGTILPAQSSCLKMLGVQGSKLDSPGTNSVTLASIVCGAVLAGELSLISALASGHLVKSHMKLNRSLKGAEKEENCDINKDSAGST